MGTTGRDTFSLPGQYNKLWGLREPGAVEEHHTSQMLKMKEGSAGIQKLCEVSPTIGHLSWYTYLSQLEISLSQMGFSITSKYVNPHILWPQQLEKKKKKMQDGCNSNDKYLLKCPERRDIILHLLFGLLGPFLHS